jgi:predicted alpha/beta superfamily hydrolase
MQTTIPLCLLLLTAQSGWAEERSISKEMASRFLKVPRTVRIYLPLSYGSAPKSRYSVLYLNDGQNLFSSAGSNICFGWGNWRLDKTVDELSLSGKMQEIILVAIDNSPARYGEYCGRHHTAYTDTNTDYENYGLEEMMAEP